MAKEKLNFKSKLHLACSDDELRPLMGCIHFKNEYAYASNGYVCIKQALHYHDIITPELLEGKSIHRDNFKAILSFETATANEDGIGCIDADGRVAFFEYYNLKDQEMPDFEHVLNNGSAKQLSFIGMKPEQVKIIGDVLFSNGYLRVTFTGIDKPIFFDCPDYDDQKAILMPSMIEESLF
jgi:hypothetical protein